MRTPLVGRLEILAAALLFSTGGAAIKLSSLSSWQLAGFRSGLAALALALVMPGWRRCWEPRSLRVGAAYAATLVLYVTANKLTTAANAIFLQGTAPLYVLLLAPRLLGERVRRRDLVFAAVLALGLGAFFVGREGAFPSAPDPTLGNAVAALSGLTWALVLVGLRGLADRAARDGNGPEAAGRAVVAGNLLAFFFCAPLAFPVDDASGLDWGVVAYLGLFQVALAYIWMTRGVQRVPALETSLLLLTEPVLNAIWAWLVHGERPGRWSLAGCTLILGATAIRTLGSHRT